MVVYLDAQGYPIWPNGQRLTADEIRALPADVLKVLKTGGAKLPAAKAPAKKPTRRKSD